MHAWVAACGGLSALTEESYKKAYAAFLFLLHLRTRDMTKPFLEVSLTQQMRGRNLSQWTFNDRVMLAVLSTDFLKKQIGKGRDADFFPLPGKPVGGELWGDLKGIHLQVVHGDEGIAGSGYKEG